MSEGRLDHLFRLSDIFKLVEQAAFATARIDQTRNLETERKKTIVPALLVPVVDLEMDGDCNCPASALQCLD